MARLTERQSAARALQRQQVIRRRLAERRQVRDNARRSEVQAVAAIAKLLREGSGAGLEIKEMAELAGITRQTAYTLMAKQGGRR